MMSELNKTVGHKNVRIATLTIKMAEYSKGEYNVLKAYAWSRLLKNNERPVSWGNPHQEGTDVDVEPITTPEEAALAIGQLADYMNQVKGRRFDGEKD